MLEKSMTQWTSTSAFQPINSYCRWTPPPQSSDSGPRQPGEGGQWCCASSCYTRLPGPSGSCRGCSHPGRHRAVVVEGKSTGVFSWICPAKESVQCKFNIFWCYYNQIISIYWSEMFSVPRSPKCILCSALCLGQPKILVWKKLLASLNSNKAMGRQLVVSNLWR